MTSLVGDTFLGMVVLLLCVGLPVGFVGFCLVWYFFRMLPKMEKQAENDLRSWARHEQMSLVSFRQVRLGQAGFVRSWGLLEYRIVVEAGDGQRQSGWVSLGSHGLSPTPPDWVQVRWGSEGVE